MTFKKGDRVKLTRPRAPVRSPTGSLATVMSAGRDFITIEWDKGVTPCDLLTVYADQFDLVAPKIDYMQITRDIVGSR